MIESEHSFSFKERMMDPDYGLFAEVVAAGSLSAAGRRLRISSAMVSKRLARLERRLGTQLVHRTTRRLSLTPAGQGFHEDVIGILAAIRAAEARISDNEGSAAGSLRVAAPTSFGRLYVAPYLKNFLDAHPRIDLQIDLSDGFTDLVGERIDLVIRIAPEIGPGLVGHRLATSRRILCAAPAYLAAAGMPSSIDDLADHCLLAATDQLPWRLEGPDGPIVVDGRSHVRTNSSEVVRELALAGVGIALRSLWDVGQDLAAGRLQRVLPDHEGSAAVGIFVAYPRAAFVPPAVTAFLDYLRGIYAVPPWEG
jgi:DNA-binding transcriptional LysR family regulator